MQPQSPDLAEIKECQRRAWALGDYAVFSAGLLIISELICEATDLRFGQKVLDVTTGSSNMVLTAIHRFCDVVGIDYVPALLERRREWVITEGLDVSFREVLCIDSSFRGTSS